MTSLRRRNWLVLTILTECLLSGRNWKFKYISGIFHSPKAVPCFRWLVASLSKRRPGFDPRSVHVRFVLGEVAMGQVFLRIIRLSLFYIIPTKLPHPHPSIRCSYQQDKRAKSGNIPRAMLFRKSGRTGKETAFTYFILRMVKARRLTLWHGLKCDGIESSYGYVWKCRVL